MKLTYLRAEHFIGARNVDVALDTPVTLFAGPNAAGKSSIRDAVALALTADLGRVSLKKDAAQLITTGAGSASVELTDVDGDTYTVTISSSGKIADSHKGREPDPVLGFVLDAQRLASLSATDRRAFLFGLTGAKMDSATVATKLAERGCDATKAARIAPLLRSGFPAAAEDAKTQATAAKGAWRAVSGETYGAVKAATWKALAVTFDARSLDSALMGLGATDAGISAAQQRVGNLDGGARRLADMRQQRAGLLGLAAELVRRKVKLQHDEMELKTWQDQLDAAQAKAGGAPRVGLVHDLARSVNALLTLGAVDLDSVVGRDADQALATYVETHGSLNAAQGDTESRERLPQITSTRDLMASAVRNSMRDVRASEEAAAQIAVLDKQIKDAGDGGAVELEAARKHLADLQAERKTNAAAVDQLRAAKASVEGATKKTAEAAKHHADVEAWDKIASALAPDGIPGEILSEALGPINSRLAQSALDAQWPPVAINAEMGITFGNRVYSLCSESEMYRADAMLAEAVAFISGARLLVLDRFDVLDLQGRSDLIAWLDVLADNGEIDTALIFGTLKALPAAGALPATFGAHWIADGVCVQAQELAEAA